MKLSVKQLRSLVSECLQEANADYVEKLEKHRAYLQAQARDAAAMAARNPADKAHYDRIVQKNQEMIAKIADNLRAMKMGEPSKYAFDI